MTFTQTEINDLAYAALDAACYAIQTKLGVDDGLHASIYFSGDNEDLVISLLSDYIKSEIQGTGQK